MSDQLQEAVAPPAFLERVKGLHKGEVAQLEGGVAVKHVALEDGRAAYRVGSPNSWGSGTTEFYGDTHRTPERAVRAAFERSARSTDPESIGGETPLTTYGTFHHGGRQVRVRGFTTEGRVMVEPADGRGSGSTVGAHALTRMAPVMLSEAARPARRRRVVRPSWGDLRAEDRRRLEPIVRYWLGPLEESAKTASLSVTHAPIGKGGTNWITKTRPGNTGQLPAYIQNVRNAIMRGGVDESRATAIAIGRIRDWAEGKGRVGPEVKAAAAKAIAEWEALRAKSHARSAVKGAASAVKESFEDGASALLEATGGVDALEACLLGALAEGLDVEEAHGRNRVGPGHRVKSGRDGRYLSKLPRPRVPRAREEEPDDGDGDAEVAEAALSARRRAKLPARAFVFPRERRYPIHDVAHARNALSRSAGRPEAARVRAAVGRRFPALKEAIVLRSNVARPGAADYGVRPATPGAGTFNATKHPRAPRGVAGGGKFISAGSSGSDVLAVQRRLGVQATGTMDSGTVAKVRAFQKANGLTVDGVVGRQTALALSGQIARAQATAPGAMGAYTRGLAARGFAVRAPRRVALRRPRQERVGGGLLVR